MVFLNNSYTLSKCIVSKFILTETLLILPIFYRDNMNSNELSSKVRNNHKYHTIDYFNKSIFDNWINFAICVFELVRYIMAVGIDTSLCIYNCAYNYIGNRSKSLIPRSLTISLVISFLLPNIIKVQGREVIVSKSLDVYRPEQFDLAEREIFSFAGFTAVMGGLSLVSGASYTACSLYTQREKVDLPTGCYAAGIIAAISSVFAAPGTIAAAVGSSGKTAAAVAGESFEMQGANTWLTDSLRRHSVKRINELSNHYSITFDGDLEDITPISTFSTESNPVVDKKLRKGTIYNNGNHYGYIRFIRSVLADNTTSHSVGHKPLKIDKPDWLNITSKRDNGQDTYYAGPEGSIMVSDEDMSNWMEYSYDFEGNMDDAGKINEVMGSKNAEDDEYGDVIAEAADEMYWADSPNTCLCLHVNDVRVSTGQIGVMPDNSYLATRQECFRDDCGQDGLNQSRK